MDGKYYNLSRSYMISPKENFSELNRVEKKNMNQTAYKKFTNI